MTKSEIINHEWTEGEKLWAVALKRVQVPGTGGRCTLHMPDKLCEITVAKVDRYEDRYGDHIIKHVVICFNGIDCAHNSTSINLQYEDSDTDGGETPADINADARFKFLTKKEASEAFARMKAEYQSKLIDYKDSLRKYANDLSDQINELEKNRRQAELDIDKISRMQLAAL